MDGLWPIFFLLVVLKIPVFGALGLVWWAIQEPKPEESPEPGTNADEGFNRWRPSPAPAAHTTGLPAAAPQDRGSAPVRRNL